MALYDDPPHEIVIQSSTSSTDAGGGVVLAYTDRTTGVKGLLNALSSDERNIFAQEGITCTHAFGTTDTSARRGDKVVYGSRSFHVTGIKTGEAMGTIPVLRYLMLNEQL